jgi:hypothetical protein
MHLPIAELLHGSGWAPRLKGYQTRPMKRDDAVWREFFRAQSLPWPLPN